MAPVDFSGTWKEMKKENFDEFGAAVGMPWMARKMAGKVYATIEIVQTDDHFKITSSMMMRSDVQEFSIGEEFIFSPPKGDVKFKSVARWEGDKLVVEATPENPESTNVVKQITTRELLSERETLVTAAVQLKDRPNTVEMKRYFNLVKT